MADLFRRTGPAEGRQPTAAGSNGAGPASVTEVAVALTSLVARAAPFAQGALTPVQVRVLQDEAVLHLQVRRGGEREAGWQELIDGLDGAVQVVLAGGVDGARVGPDGPGTMPSPFTAREQQVARLLSEGLSDRAIADALHISHKTAEKHVGAVLRKTHTTSRTAAVVRTLRRGWLSEGPTATS